MYIKWWRALSFQLDEYDAVSQMLQELPTEGEEAYVTSLTARRKRELEAINSQLSDRVIKNYDAFVGGMMQIQELVRDTRILCSEYGCWPLCGCDSRE